MWLEDGSIKEETPLDDVVIAMHTRERVWCAEERPSIQIRACTLCTDPRRLSLVFVLDLAGSPLSF